MKQFKSEHYIFNYGAGTKAEQDIAEIAAYQEACFRYICNVLGVMPEFKIEYFLCDSPEEVGRIYGDNDPCNGFAAPPNKIYAVYNQQVQCIGFHEDAHIISYTVYRTVLQSGKVWLCTLTVNGGVSKTWTGRATT